MPGNRHRPGAGERSASPWGYATDKNGRQEGYPSDAADVFAQESQPQVPARTEK
jgi:hypothetical protein